jgi:hypothetical protein
VTILPWIYGYYSSIHFKLLTHRLRSARPVAKWTLEWKGTHIRVLNLISWLDSTEYAGVSSFSRLYDLHAGTPPSGRVISPTQRSLLGNTTLTTDRQPCPRRDLNPQSQETSGRILAPLSTWPPGSATNKQILHNYLTNEAKSERRHKIESVYLWSLRLIVKWIYRFCTFNNCKYFLFLTVCLL